MKTILQQLEPANIPLEKQVDLLAQFLIENFESDIDGNGQSAGEGAIEMAVRLLTKLKEPCEMCKLVDRISIRKSYCPKHNYEKE